MAAIALLDDYQNVALRMADWSRLQRDHRVVVFNERLPDVDACARALADFDVIGIMRERTPFPRALFERLPKLRCSSRPASATPRSILRPPRTTRSSCAARAAAACRRRSWRSG